jgi:hypothetical protein
MLLKPSTHKGKRLMAVFNNGKTVHFGLAGGSTYVDHGDKAKRAAYLKRHLVNENWNDPYTAGSLSRYLLWGDSTSLDKNHNAYMKRFPQTEEK